MIVHILAACGLDPAYVVGGELRGTGANAGWGEGEWIVVEADESDRSLLRAVARDRGADQRRARPSRDLRLAARSRGDAPRVHGPRHAERRGLGPPGAARALSAGRASPTTPPTPRARRTGSRFHWRGIEVALSVPGLHNAVNAAGALTAAALAGADPAAGRGRAGRLPRAPAGGSSCSGPPRPASRCTTTTPTTRPRSRRRSPPRGRSRRRGWSRSSSRTCTRARARSRASSAARWPAPTWSWCSTSTRRASAPRTSRASTGTWSRRPPPTPPAGGRWPGCRRSTTPARSWRATLREGDLCLMMGAGDVDALAVAGACVGPAGGALLPCSAMAELPAASSATTRWPA